jgi:hypothetical protein
MIKVAIVRDESSYGKKSYETIRQEFETELINIESPSGVFIDDIELDKKIIDKLSRFDILITYIKQADMTLELVEKLHEKVSWIIIGIWRGEGFKNQLLKYKNVSVPDVLSEMETNGNPNFNEFVSKIGNVEIKINCQNEKIIDFEP